MTTSNSHPAGRSSPERRFPGRFCEHLIPGWRSDGPVGYQLLFCPGMLFGSPFTWWGDRDLRPRPHEGIDICFYRSSNGTIGQLAAGTSIPAMDAGEIVTICDDFLGRSVFIGHEQHDQGRRLVSIYGHTAPHRHLKTGTSLSAGQSFAVIADARSRRAPMPSHIHLSLAWVSDCCAHRDLTWQTLNDPQHCTLIDPLAAIDCAFRIISKTDLHPSAFL